MSVDPSMISQDAARRINSGGEQDFVKSNECAIVIKNLSKSYRHQKAVDMISFSVSKGEIFGFLGPNGAGKTTTIKVLTTLLRPTQGTIQVCGFDVLKNPLEVKKRIGYMPDVPGFYGEMKAFEILDFYAEFYKIPREVRRKKIDEILTMMQLFEVKNKKIKTFSRGMKQKVGFASALLNDPEVLILDEPTIGLDPETIHFFRKLMKSLNEKGVTIFLSSHILSEVQAICDRVGIIQKGKIVAVDSIQGLSKKVSAKKNMMLVVTYENMTDEAVGLVQQIPGVIKIVNNSAAKKLEVEISPEITSIALINRTLVKLGIGVVGLESKQPSLEDIFLALTGGDSS